MSSRPVEIVQITRPGEASPALRSQIADCWIAVTNAGGAAGFPFPPVNGRQVEPAVDELVAGLHPERSRLLVARSGGDLAGWVLLRRDPGPLIGHWGTVHHLQSRPAWQGQGIGTALMEHLRVVARDELGLEDFYARLGWRETGRWPGKLRLAPGDTRDEILMIIAPL